MTARTDLIDRVLAALAEVAGVRPASPAVNASFGRWSLDALAVDVGNDVIEVRLVATVLPLPPLLERTAEALEPVVAGSEYGGARLRLVVVDVDRGAFV
jgi:hypothetical protein